MQEKPIFLIITGMHRSGTSCLAGCLQENGVYLGNVVQWAPHNLKGNMENKDVMSLNESILKNSGGSWDNPPELIRWTVKQVKKKEQILKILKSNNNIVYGFKDPRSVFTLPFWHQDVKNLKVIISFRHPLLVAKSLNRRNKMPLGKGLDLWKKYNSVLLQQIKNVDYQLVSFDQSAQDYLDSMKRLINFLGLNNTASIKTSFIDTSLINQGLSDLKEDIPDDISKIYNELTSLFIKQSKTVI